MSSHDWGRDDVCVRCDRAKSRIAPHVDNDCDGNASALPPVPAIVDPKEAMDALILLATVARSRESAFQSERIEIAIRTLRSVLDGRTAQERLDEWVERGPRHVRLVNLRPEHEAFMVEIDDDNHRVTVSRTGHNLGAARASALAAINSGEI